MRMLLAICIVSACGTGASAAEWLETQSTAGNFKVSLPGKPMQMKRTLNTPVGKIDLHMFLVPVSGNKGVFAVMYNDYPDAVTQNAKPSQILDRALKGSVQAKNGKISKSAEVKIDGFPGKSVQFDGSSGGKKLTGTVRVYLVKQRLYQLLVFSQDGAEIKQSEIDQFHKSFARLKK